MRNERDVRQQITLGRGVRPHMLFKAAFHLATDALQPQSVPSADGEGRLRDLVRQQSPLVHQQSPSLVIDNLGKLKPAQADQVSLQDADKADREALARARAAVKGFDVEVVVVHHVDYDYAHELLRDGCVDAVEQADTPESPWMRDKVEHPEPAISGAEANR